MEVSTRRAILYSGSRKRQLIFLDTMCFIYHFEESRSYLPVTSIIFDSVEKGDIFGATSVLTIHEIFTGAKRGGDIDLVESYRTVFKSFPHLSIYPIDLKCAEISSDLRVKYGLKTPDALQLASALSVKADAYITNDECFKRVKEIDVLLIKSLRGKS